jgi:hypothetical protein
MSWTCLIGIASMEAFDLLIHLAGPFNMHACYFNVVFKVDNVFIRI